jgi:hypothetical protein
VSIGPVRPPPPDAFCCLICYLVPFVGRLLQVSVTLFVTCCTLSVACDCQCAPASIGPARPLPPHTPRAAFAQAEAAEQTSTDAHACVLKAGRANADAAARTKFLTRKRTHARAHARTHERTSAQTQTTDSTQTPTHTRARALERMHAFTHAPSLHYPLSGLYSPVRVHFGAVREQQFHHRCVSGNRGIVECRAAAVRRHARCRSACCGVVHQIEATMDGSRPCARGQTIEKCA